MSKALADLAQPCRRLGQNCLIIAAENLEAWAAQQHLPLRQAYLQALAAGIFPESLERNFPTFTCQQQLQLCNCRVLIAGLGGLGGYQAQLLARAGIGSLLLADGDKFVPANLNRQLFATRETLGQAKTAVTAAFLRRINPVVEINLVSDYLDPDRYPVLLPQVDLALDALDSCPARRQLVSAAREAGKPVIHGAVLGHDGQITTILPEDLPTFAEAYLHQSAPPDEPPSVVAPIVAMVASLQVLEAIRLLLHLPPAYHGSLAYLDGYTGRMEFFPL